MAFTVRELLSIRSLGLLLRFEGADGALDAQIHWVHQSELVDSTLFTEPGEVLMTTGSRLPRPDETSAEELGEIYRHYVHRLCDSSVVALGFGVGDHHDCVPDELLRSAHRYGLPVFEIPWELPFSAVIKAVSKSRSDAEHAYLRRTNSAQRRLIAAAGRPNVAQSVVSSTAQIISGWAVLVDRNGRMLVHTHTDQLTRAALAVRQHMASGKTVSFADDEHSQLCVHTIAGSEDQPRGFLVAGTPGELDPLAISTCLLASNLLGIFLSLTGRLETALAEMRSSLIAEALAGNADLVLRAGKSVWPKTPHDPVQLGCVEGTEAQLGALRLTDIPAAWGQLEGRLWIVTRPAMQARLATQMDEDGLRAGWAPTCSWRELGEARSLALGDLLRHDTDHGADEANPRVNLVDLLPRREAEAFARTRLGPIIDPGNHELLTTLAAWLDADGALDIAAANLGVHRHTISRRMRRVCELLGLGSLDHSARHDLWFACQVLAHHGELPKATAS